MKMWFFGCVLLLLSNVLVLDNFVKGAVLFKNKDKLFRLDIVHYNDFHDRFEETSVQYPVCKTNDSECLGGFARLYQEVMTLLEQKPGALLLNAGDTFQGTYWYTLLKWNVTQNFINMLPNDAHAIGNHEFDDGIAGLAPYLRALKAPVVAANIDTTKEPALDDLYQPHVVLKRQGRKIGVIGLITPDTMTSSNPQGVRFLDPLETVQREAKVLTQKGVDIIIVLSHCGLEVDIEMAKKVGENIDIIVGGHSHHLLWNGTAPSKERVAGPYPLTVNTESSPGHKVLVVTASAMSKYMGNLTVFFDDAGEIQDFDGQPVFLNRSIPEDQNIKALLQPYKQKLDTLVNEVIGHSTDELSMEQCGSKECAVGNLAADSLRDAAIQKYGANSTTIAFLIRNMFRGSISKGDITRGEVINFLPFTNAVVVYRIQGRHILETFAICLKSYYVKKPFSGPHMPQVSGIKLTLNTTSGAVVSALVPRGEEWVPLDPEMEYQLVTPKFLLNEGNQFTPLKQGKDIRELGTDAQLIEAYIKKITPITPKLDGRLTIVT